METLSALDLEHLTKRAREAFRTLDAISDELRTAEAKALAIGAHTQWQALAARWHAQATRESEAQYAELTRAA